MGRLTEPRRPAARRAAIAWLPLLAALAIPVFSSCGRATHPAAPPDQRPSNWAEPLSKPGLPNLHKVSDTLYRGAQPTEDGFKELRAMGIRTIVNLRSRHTDDDEAGSLPFKKVLIRCKAWDPEDDQTSEFLKIVSDPANHPVFVHCQHGADRTGLMSAVYRMAVQGWSREAAIEEMTRGGFGYHPVWDDLLDYLLELDVGELKKKAESKSEQERLFPGYRPKDTPDTARDYRPGIGRAFDGLPAEGLDRLEALLRSLAERKAAAKDRPGGWTEGNIMLGGDEKEYRPSDEELVECELGERIRRTVESAEPAALAGALRKAGIGDEEVTYRTFEFRHVDAMGSGRFFFASAPKAVGVRLKR